MRLAEAVRGLEDYWQRQTFRAPAQPTAAMADRILLDALGLGLEQVMTRLGRERPDLATFEAWITETVGSPDRRALARYHAWLDGTAPPDRVRVELAAIDAAAPVLDAADLAHWDAQGFVIVRSAISQVEADAAAAVLRTHVGAGIDDPDSWYARHPNGIMIQLFQHHALDVARRSARVHKAFAQLWGTADLWSTVDRLSFNPPERPGHKFPGPHLHWDVSLARPIPFATQGILYLTDTTADQGALQLVPGFHHRIDGWLDRLDGADPRQVDLSGEARTIAGGAGDLLIWRQDLPHGASPNTSDRPRLAQYVNMYSAELLTHPAWV